MTGQNKIPKMERGENLVTKDNGKAKDFCAFLPKSFSEKINYIQGNSGLIGQEASNVLFPPI